MKIKTLICNCKGLSPAFRKADMNTLPFEIESDLDVDYAIVHSQLCGEGGTKLLEDVLRSAEDDPETLVIVGACELEAQQKLFGNLLRGSGIDKDHYASVDIRNMTNNGILERLREKIEGRIHPKKRRR